MHDRIFNEPFLVYLTLTSKVFFAGNVRRNDIARGLLSFIAETTFAFAAQFCSASNITHLYIGGTLTDSFQEFREDLYKCFVHRKYWYPKVCTLNFWE